MNDEEIFERWLQAHANADTASMEQYMDDDFVFEQEGFPKQLGKEEYLDLVDAMGNAFPDLELDAETHDTTEGEIRWRKQLSATHEQDLDLTGLGLPIFFPTGADVDMDADEARTHVEDGKIARHEVSGEDTGLSAMLSQVEDGLADLRQSSEVEGSWPD